MRNKIASWLGCIILIVGGSYGAYWFLGTGFRHLESLRQLQRVPHNEIGTILPGEVTTSGVVVAKQPLLLAPYSKRDSVYYRYEKERKSRDSNGNTQWRTEHSEERVADFWLQDETGRALVKAEDALSLIHWSLPRSHLVNEGNIRHSEWRIEPGENLFVFASAKVDASKIYLNFSTPGFYTPIIANQSQSLAQNTIARRGMFALWAGLACTTLIVLGVVFLLKVHRVLVYLSWLTVVLMLVLSQVSFTMMQRDLRNGIAHYQQQRNAAQEEITRLLNSSRLTWPGWDELEALTATAKDELKFETTRRIRAYLLNLEATRQSLNQQMHAQPERWLYPFWGLQAPAPFAKLTTNELSLIERRLSIAPKIKLAGVGLYVMFCVSALLALLATWTGYRLVRLKRLIENIPSSPTLGVSCGSAELNGTVVLPEGAKPLYAPDTQSPCVWFSYLVQEKISTGKNEHWKTKEKREQSLPFLCRDTEGDLQIDPKHAEVITRHRHSYRKGKMRYTERFLAPGDSLYALGSAQVNPIHMGQLILAKGNESEPFILSNLNENQVMLKKARLGIAALNFAIIGFLFTLLLWLSAQGDFAATDLLWAALLAPVYLISMMLVLHYNDLIFLQRRALRNWANIQIALRKRKNIFISLEPVIQKMFTHEQQILVDLTALRATVPEAELSAVGATKFLHKETQLIRHLRRVCEQYPNIKSDEVIRKFMQTLSDLETEIALLRQGYNDAVTLYNTRLQTVPDVVIAMAFRFSALPLMQLS